MYASNLSQNGEAAGYRVNDVNPHGDTRVNVNTEDPHYINRFHIIVANSERNIRILIQSPTLCIPEYFSRPIEIIQLKAVRLHPSGDVIDTGRYTLLQM